MSAWRWLVIVLLSGCGTSATAPAPRWPFEPAKLSLAEAKAPDIYVLAEKAADHSERASKAGRAAEAADLRTQSRLLIAAAIAEAERAELDVRRLELERQEEVVRKEAAAQQQARIEMAQQIAQKKASSIALREAEAAHVLAERQERGRRQDKLSLRRAREVLVDRASSSLAAAEALGADRERVQILNRRLVQAEASKSLRLDDVERLIGDVYTLLGEVRATVAQPSRAMTTSLVSAAQESGFAAERLPHGVVITIERMFTLGGQVNAFRARRLAELAHAFPHGPVQCSVLTDSSSRATARLARALTGLLGNSGSDRVSVETRPSEKTPSPVTQCTFVAYGE